MWRRFGIRPGRPPTIESTSDFSLRWDEALDLLLDSAGNPPS